MLHISTADKSQRLVANIAKRAFNANELDVYQYDSTGESDEAQSARMDGIVASLPFGEGTTIFQAPTWNPLEWDEKLLKLIQAYNNKVIIFVHDILALVYESNRYQLPAQIKYYNLADAIIVPTQGMADFLRANGLTVKHVIVQEMWDCLHDIPADMQNRTKPKFNHTINFAGDVNLEKFAFYQDLDLDHLKMKAYCDNKNNLNVHNLELTGYLPEETMLNELRRTGGFGLVWGDEHWRQYMGLNCSYKLSSYLAAGLPVIVPRTCGQADIVAKNNLGMVVDSLDEVNERVQAATPEQYEQWLASVESFAQLIRHGMFTRKAITKALFAIYDQRN